MMTHFWRVPFLWHRLCHYANHPEKYTEAERKQIRELFNKAAELNKVLDKYDVEKKINWFEFLEVSNKYFDQMDY
jgi:hypothetical protein